ncbi:Cyclin-dependent kinases regulatory subunit [Intoshia linei]|uniref:Cyclin-dependent kinases regulatory subunit n=1 Tax=Intoshia linei TaxID=1819745 RepID=A0A177B0R1_9BILA|nr:Cyclin-dependent kinases regulatory subunit [Intoshia linei]
MELYYSDKYFDQEYEYRHIVLPKNLVEYIPTNRLMTEVEWRALGVKQSRGWEHYMKWSPGMKYLMVRKY